MAASRFLRRYERFCEEDGGVEPLQGVITACKHKHTTLDLSGVCLSREMCSIIERTLKKGHPFTELTFADCLVGDEGMASLLSALHSDCQVTVLNIKGNNLHSTGNKLKELVKHNTTLNRLILGWNNLGSSEESMASLADGLAVNQHLASLDLSSNHISHTGMALLAAALFTNISLKQLDLRWNNIGLLGGQALLSLLEQNCSSALCRLDLLGNNIPDDLVKAIMATVQLRAEQHSMEELYLSQQELLTSQMRELRQATQTKVSQLNEEMDTVRESCIDLTRRAQDEINDLKAALSIRHSEIAVLEERLAATTAAKEMSESLNEGTRQSYNELQREYSEALSHFEKDLKERDEVIAKCRAEEEERVLQQGRREAELKKQIQSLEHEREALQQEVSHLQQQLRKAQEHSETRLQSVQRELEAVHSSEELKLQQANKDHAKLLTESERNWEHERSLLLKRLSLSEVKVTELLKEIEESNRRTSVDRMESARDIDKLHHSFREQMDKREKQLQEHITTLLAQQERDKLQISELQVQMKRLDAEKRSTEEELKQRVSQCSKLSKTLEEERAEFDSITAHQSKVREQLMNQVESSDRETREMKAALESERLKGDDMRRKLRDEVRTVQLENDKLKDSLQRESKLMERMREEEAERAQRLKTALDQYISRK